MGCCLPFPPTTTTATTALCIVVVALFERDPSTSLHFAQTVVGCCLWEKITIIITIFHTKVCSHWWRTIPLGYPSLLMSSNYTLLLPMMQESPLDSCRLATMKIAPCLRSRWAQANDDDVIIIVVCIIAPPTTHEPAHNSFVFVVAVQRRRWQSSFCGEESRAIMDSALLFDNHR